MRYILQQKVITIVDVFYETSPLFFFFFNVNFYGIKCVSVGLCLDTKPNFEGTIKNSSLKTYSSILSPILNTPFKIQTPKTLLTILATSYLRYYFEHRALLFSLYMFLIKPPTLSYSYQAITLFSLNADNRRSLMAKVPNQPLREIL